MSRIDIRLGVCAAISAAVLLSLSSASAQVQIKPRILIIFDTSTSMLLDISAPSEDEVYTHGDGSLDPWIPNGGTEPSRVCCPGSGNSRMYAAKEAMRQMVEATGDIEFSLMKYAQEYSPETANGWTDDSDEIPIVDYIKYRGNQETTGDDVMRYRSWWFNGACLPAFADYGDEDESDGLFDAQWLCVGFPSDTEDNRDAVLMWMDHHEFAPDGSGDPDDSTLGRMDLYEQELRAAGSTPLANSMYAAEQYLESVYDADVSEDAGRAACRPYSVILLTDGDESCGGNAAAAATSLHHLENMGDNKEVQIYVIGLNLNSTELDTIAAEGGTVQAYGANSQDALSAVLYEIINASLLVEKCNGVDDDCDELVDEGFEKYCNTWSGTTCGAEGTKVTGATLCERQSECACDGIDNNCDGLTDEPPDGNAAWPVEENACGGCDSSISGQEYCTNPDEGRCDRGNLVCTPGSGYSCVGNQEPVPETCNGLDDDCDGETDEGMSGDACGNCGDGQRMCVGGATLCCGADSTAADCKPLRSPTSETCNGVDDDCDGTTDEDVFQACGGCVDVDCEDPNEGVCAEGRATCSNGEWNACGGEIGPTEEICDLLDNDCDGETDEGVKGVSCGACDDGNYYCVDSGEQCCAGLDTDGHCTPVRVPSAETCNGMDDDCDGETDEDVAPRECPNVDEPYFGIGVCRKGYETCRDNRWGNVEPATGEWTEGFCLGLQEPSNELCDGLDNDCNGETDEGMSGAEGCGPCGDGKEECIDGILQCVDATPPKAETCNGIDDNCNGLTDEGLALACGGCRLIEDAAADTNPDGEVPGAYEDCLQAQEADTEIGAGEGECQEGARFCDPNAEDLWGECLGSIGPSAERCDAKDNDCDGSTDEEAEIENVNEVCATAVGICEEAWWRCVDDDEGGKNLACCKDVANDGTCIAPEGPQVEICDGVDNDCDGATDEDLPDTGETCGVDMGACEPGTVECVCGIQGDPDNCGLQCVGEMSGTDEICDGLDNDCDGATDEDLPLGDECTNAPGGEPAGECNIGYEECFKGEYICNANGPADEICDGLDNDCDGETDENLAVECPDGSMCIEGDCAPPCVGQELQCPSGLICVETTSKTGNAIRICTTDVCRKGSDTALPCVDNLYWCDEGYEPMCKCNQALRKCVSICEGVLCPDGKTCVPSTGQCQTIGDDCFASGCPIGELCRGGKCTADPCAGVTCESGEYCNYTGECVSPCVDMNCPVRCFEGVCVDPCDGVSCEPGEVCNDVTGACETTNACEGVTCKFYEICLGGTCVEDPCYTIACPNGLMCEDGTCRAVGEKIIPHDTDETDSTEDKTDTTPEDTTTDEVADSENDTTPDNSYGMDRVLATGMGGCLCSATPGAAPSRSGGWMLMLGLLGLFARFSLRRTRAVKVKSVGMMLAALLWAASCTTDPYVFNKTDADGNDTTHIETDTVDNSTDSIDLSTNSDERPTDSAGCVADDPDDDCDGVDDDCDGETDEGVDLKTSSQFCGSCDNDCRGIFENAFGLCEDGACIMGDCAPSYKNRNKDNSDGCEYYCVKRADEDKCNGVDLGDGSYQGLDDDCDGETDEESDLTLQTDVYNCGRCGNVCSLPHVQMRCADGKCVYDASKDCDENFHDLNQEAKDGCEYACEKVSDEETNCDKRDEDCDGLTDEGNPESGGACYDLSEGCTINGDEIVCPKSARCIPGVWTCQRGALVCDGQVGPAPMEECNGIDDNCNGEVDENLVQSCTSGGDDFKEIGVCRKGYRLCKDGHFDNDSCEGEMLPSEEVCDGFDNDCDGETDEGDDGGALVGEACGRCGGKEYCIGGLKRCCLALDTDGSCIEPKAPAKETCNGFDDDCDGLTDNNIAETLCDGDDADDCAEGMRSCQGGNMVCSDNTGDNAELCDGLDNDCDGDTDEDDPDLSGPSVGVCNEVCGDAYLGATCLGASGWRCNYDCDAVQCTAFGQLVLQESLCDGIDNDCDGETDENLTSTAESCGACDNRCAEVEGENVASTVCVLGECRVSECDPGYYNLDGNLSCEYGCEVQGAETAECDGIDNDCNGMTDERASTTEICDGVDNDCDAETDEDLQSPDLCNAQCPVGSFEVTCDGMLGWRCHYDCDVLDCADETDDTQIAAQEARCDGVDGNCDGSTDEGFALWGETSTFDATCDNGGMGACHTQGVVKCSQDGSAYECCTSSANRVCAVGDMVAETVVPGVEDLMPNGIDEDCDGFADDGATGCVETVSVSGPSGTYEVFRYEASRASATTNAVCSGSGAAPWTNVNFEDARYSCLLLNASDTGCSFDDPDNNGTNCWDLCDASQWFHTCAYAAGDATVYPYGDPYAAARCNGRDFSPTQDALQDTGAATQCTAAWTGGDVLDLSGNAQEWTLEPRTNGTETLRVIRGGSYKDVAAGLRCDNDFFTGGEADFQLPQIGFRCCRGAMPLTACAMAIDLVKNRPFDFDNGSLCSIDGFVSKGDFEVGNATFGSPPLLNGCLIGTNPGGNYSADRRSTATSPTMDLSACEGNGDGVAVSFDMFFTNGGDTDDLLRMLVSDDGGSTWHRMRSFNVDAAAWTTYTQDVSLYANTDAFQIKFVFDSDTSGEARGVYIDNINIRRTAYPGTPATGPLDADVADDPDDVENPCGTVLPAVIRDFSENHEDFESYDGSVICFGLLQNDLDANGKPVAARIRCADNDRQFYSTASFAGWYVDDYNPAYTFTENLQLEDQDGDGIYTYPGDGNGADFFPIDDLGYGNEGNSHNFHFTTEINTYFMYMPPQQFEFAGDDDLWVFIDNKLVVDVGGLHPARYGRVSLTGSGVDMVALSEHNTNGTSSTNITNSASQNLGLVTGYIYSLRVFHAERHTNQSNFRIDTNLCLQNID